MYDVTMEKSENHPIDMARIKELMKARGVGSQAELARRANLNPSTVSRLFKENGRQSGSADTLSALAVALGTTVDYLRGETNEPRRSEAEPLPEYALEVLEGMKLLDRSRKYEVLLYVQGLVRAKDELRQMTRNEIAHEVMGQLREVIMSAADKMGRGEELDQFLEQQMQRFQAEEWNSRNSSERNQSNEDDDPEGSNEPPK